MADIKAGGAYVEIFATTDKLRKALAGAKKDLQAFGAGLKNIGAGSMAFGAGLVTPLLGAAIALSKSGDELEKMSKRTGASVEALSELGYAAELGGTSLATVEMGMKKLNLTIYKTARGSKEMVSIFDTLGLSVKDLVKLAPDQRFQKVAEQVNKIQDPLVKSAIAMKLFAGAGASGGNELIPMFEGLAAARKEAQDVGVVFKTDEAAKAANLNDAIARLRAGFKSIVLEIGSAVAPMLTELGGYILGAIKPIRSWIQNNQELFPILLKVGAIALSVGAALFALGTAITPLLAIGSALGSVVGFITAGLGLLAAPLTIAIGLIGALTTPIGLAISAFAALGVVAYNVFAESGAAVEWFSGVIGVFGTNVKSVFEWVGGLFGTLKTTALASFTGIKDALAAGDWKLAAEILWVGVKTAFFQGVQPLIDIWRDAKSTILSVWNTMSSALAIGVLEGMGTVQTVWLDTTSELGTAWDWVWAGARNTFDNFMSWIGNSFRWIANKWDSWVVGPIKKIGALFESAFTDSNFAELSAKIDSEIEVKYGDREKKSAEVNAETQKGIDEREHAYDREQARKKELNGYKRQAIKDQTDGAQLAIVEEQQKESSRIKEARALAEKGDQERMSGLQNELAALSAKAKEEAVAATEENAAPKLQTAGELVDPKKKTAEETRLAGLSMEDLTKKAGGASKETESKSSAAVSFNLARSDAFAMAGVQERTAKASEETNAKLDKMIEIMGDVDEGGSF